MKNLPDDYSHSMDEPIHFLACEESDEKECICLKIQEDIEESMPDGEIDQEYVNKHGYGGE